MACRTQAEIAAAALPNPCVLQRGTRTTDGLGGTTTAWSPVASTVCLVSLHTDELESTVADRLKDRPAYRVRIPAAVEAELDDRLVVDGRTFEVVAIARPPHGTAGFLTVAEV